MRKIKFFMSILYEYYSKGPTSSVAYIKTLIAMVALVFLIIVDILLLTDNVDIILLGHSESKAFQYLIIALFTLPILVFFLIFFKEKKLTVSNYSEEKIKKGRMFVLWLIILVVLSLPVILIFQNGI